MGIQTIPEPAAGKTSKIETLTSGTSWTVPAGVTYVNATLIGGGGGSASGANEGNDNANLAAPGNGGVMITTTVATTPAATISYAIGAGGAGATAANGSGSTGGTTTFTGATSAAGGIGGKHQSTAAGTNYLSAGNYGNAAKYNATGGAGGSGCIILEYWV